MTTATVAWISSKYRQVDKRNNKEAMYAPLTSPVLAAAFFHKEQNDTFNIGDYSDINRLPSDRVLFHFCQWRFFADEVASASLLELLYRERVSSDATVTASPKKRYV